jgi:hypothetical protein
MSRHKEPTTLVVLESDFEFRDLIRSVIWGSSSEYVLRFASSTSEAAALMEGRDPGERSLSVRKPLGAAWRDWGWARATDHAAIYRQAVAASVGREGGHAIFGSALVDACSAKPFASAHTAA